MKMKIMEWSDDIVLHFLNDVEHLPVLWNNRHPNHKIMQTKNDAWETLASKYNRPSNDLRKKWQSLQASYRRERAKDEPSHWFAYDAMGFLKPEILKRNSIKKKDSTHFVECDPLDVPEEEEEEVEEEEEEEVELENVIVPKNEVEEGVYTSDDDAKVVPNKLITSNKRKRKRFVTQRPVPVIKVNRTPIIRSPSERDEFMIYGEYVSSKLRKLDNHSSTIAQHYINKILFEAEIGKYKDLQFTDDAV